MHLVGAAAAIAVYLLGAPPGGSAAYLAAAALTGLMLVGTEWFAHPQLWRQMSGCLVVVKLLLLGLVFAFEGAAGPLVLASFIVAALGSHFPKRWRCHRVL